MKKASRSILTSIATLISMLIIALTVSVFWSSDTIYSSACSDFNNNQSSCNAAPGCSYPGNLGSCSSFNDGGSCASQPGCSVNTSDCGSLNDGGGDGTSCSTQPACLYDSGSGVCSGTYFSSCSGNYDNGSCVGTLDDVAPVLSTATLNGMMLTLTYNESLNTGSVPATTNFVVSVNGSPTTVSSVSVTGSTVILSLASGISGLSTVVIDYTPDGNPIEDLLGNNAVSLSGQSVSNNGDAVAPSLVSATVEGNAVTLTYSEELNPSFVPASGDFTLHGTTAAVSSVVVTSSTTVLMLDKSVLSGDTVTLDYALGVSPIQDFSMNNAAGLSGQSVSNNTSTTAPSVETLNVHGTLLTLAYDKTLDTFSVPATTDFAVYVNASPVTIDSVSISSSTVSLVLTGAVGDGSVVTLNYTPGTDKIQDVSGNHAAPLASRAVTNIPTTPPSLVNANIDGDGGFLTLAYDKTIDDSSVPAASDFAVYVNASPVTIDSVSISSSTVTLRLSASILYTDIVTLDYVPGVRHIQDVAGHNDAMSLSNQAISNTVISCKDIGLSGSLQASTIVGTKIYVPNLSSNTVFVVDLKTDTLLNTITVGDGPYSSTLVGTKLYVNNINSHNVSVVDTTTDTVVQTIGVGVAPYFSASYGSKIYVNDEGGNTVSIIDTTTDTRIKTLGVSGHQDHSIAFNGKMYVLNLSSDNISIIDTKTDTVVKTIAVGVRPTNGTIIGNKIYVNNASSGNISVIDTDTDTVIATIPVGLVPIYSVAVGAKLYVVNQSSSTVSVIDSNSNTVVRTISVEAQPSFISVLGTKAYVNNRQSNSVSIIDTDTDTVIKTITTGASPTYSSIFENKLYVNNLDGTISIIDTVNDRLFAPCSPHLLSFTSTSPNGTYTSGSLNITANFNKPLGAGSKIRITLNTGAVVNLTSVSGSALSGLYTITNGETTPDLSVSNISNNPSYTSVSDTSSPANTNTSFIVPFSPELTGDVSRNLGDLKDIVVGDSLITIPVGVNPYQMVTVGSLIYEANEGSDNVKVIDTSTNTITATIPVGSQPYGVAYNSSSKEIYVANLKGNSVSVIDADPAHVGTTYNTVIDTISSQMMLEPYYVASLGTKIYVTNNISWTVSVIDTVSHTVSDTISVGANPRGIKAHGTDLYVSNFGSAYGQSAQGTVSVINSLNNAVTATIPVGSGPRGVAVNGSDVYVANWNDNTVSVIHTSNNTVTHTLSVGLHPRGILALNNKIYVENFDDGTISVIDGSTYAVTGPYKVGTAPSGMTAVGTDLYISRFTDDVVSIFNTNTLALRLVGETDVTPPIISSVVASTTDTAAMITWITDESATSTINFGTSTSYGTASSSAVSTTSQRIILTNLTASTTYHFMISSWDALGNLATTTDATFTTTQADSGPADTTSPVLTGAVVNGSTLTLTYDEALDSNSISATSTYAVTVGGVSVPVTAIQVTGSTVVLTLSSPVIYAQTVTLSYTVPGSNPIQDIAGNDVASLTGVSVTNNTPAVSSGGSGGGSSGGGSSSSVSYGGGGSGGGSSFSNNASSNINNTSTSTSYSNATSSIMVAVSPQGVCAPYIVSAVPIQLGTKNSPDTVKKIQTFLNTYEDANLVVDGVYKQADYIAVQAFQSKYETQILSPWNYSRPTGIVFTTTIAKMNAVVCGQNLHCPVFTKNTDVKSMHDEVPRIKNFLNQILGLKLVVNQNMNLETVRAIAAFQTRYKEFILKPLNLSRATGLWYASTIKQANLFMGCPVR